jgi:hypothetical protein
MPRVMKKILIDFHHHCYCIFIKLQSIKNLDSNIFKDLTRFFYNMCQFFMMENVDNAVLTTQSKYEHPLLPKDFAYAYEH